MTDKRPTQTIISYNKQQEALVLAKYYELRRARRKENLGEFLYDLGAALMHVLTLLIRVAGGYITTWSMVILGNLTRSGDTNGLTAWYFVITLVAGLIMLSAGITFPTKREFLKNYLKKHKVAA